MKGFKLFMLVLSLLLIGYLLQAEETKESGIVFDAELGFKEVTFDEIPTEWYFKEEIGYVFKHRLYIGFFHYINLSELNSSSSLDLLDIGGRIEYGVPGLCIGATSTIDVIDDETMNYNGIDFYVRLSFGKKWREGY